MIKNYNKRLKWFQDRIGKTIYRGSLSCDCEICKAIEAAGVEILDKDHAKYLTDTSFEMNVEYRDKK